MKYYYMLKYYSSTFLDFPFYNLTTNSLKLQLHSETYIS